MTTALIGLGSNLGDRKATLDTAVQKLWTTRDVSLVHASSYHETQPMGGPSGQLPFLNAAAAIETALNPHELLCELQRIELECGRVREKRWGPRTLDLDILLYGDQYISVKNLVVPHRLFLFRRFALEPAVEVAAKFCIATIGWTVEEAFSHLNDAAPVFEIWSPVPNWGDVVAFFLRNEPGLENYEFNVWHGYPLGDCLKKDTCKAIICYNPAFQNDKYSRYFREYSRLRKAFKIHELYMKGVPLLDLSKNVKPELSELSEVVVELSSILQSMH